MQSNKIIIGVSGGSGSGKTSFVKSLRAQFSEDDLCLISMDEYYHPREDQLTDKEGIKNFDLPSSLDAENFKNDIVKLANGESVEKMEYTFNNALKQSSILKFKPAPVIIVEGLFIFHYKEIANLLNYKVFISANDVNKVIRRIKRDRIERNYPLEDVLYRYVNHVKPSFEQFIGPYKDQADLIINNNSNFEKGLEVLSGFIKNQLK